MNSIGGRTLQVQCRRCTGSPSPLRQPRPDRLVARQLGCNDSERADVRDEVRSGVPGEPGRDGQRDGGPRNPASAQGQCLGRRHRLCRAATEKGTFGIWC